MVKYDSASHLLQFKKSIQLNGETFYTNSSEISLKDFDEVTRQFIISMAKQIVNFANGHDFIVENVQNLKKGTNPSKEPIQEEKDAEATLSVPTQSE